MTATTTTTISLSIHNALHVFIVEIFNLDEAIRGIFLSNNFQIGQAGNHFTNYIA